MVGSAVLDCNWLEVLPHVLSWGVELSFLFSEVCLKIFVLVNLKLFLSTWAEFLQPCSKHHIFLLCLAYGLMDIFFTHQVILLFLMIAIIVISPCTSRICIISLRVVVFGLLVLFSWKRGKIEAKS